MALYAFDGTWNTSRVDDDVEDINDTNVVNFHQAYGGPKWYVSGVGTRFGKLGHFIGGLTGAGSFQRIDEGYQALCENWQKGDKVIDIVGFSRGAALALDFANRIAGRGIQEPGSKRVVEEKPSVRFLGLWDVVGSFGMPINVPGFNAQEVNLGHKFEVPGCTEYCFHAMAIDERRQTFRVTRLLNSYEVWFRGAHSDIGGGNGNTGLSNIALRWMLRKAKAAGLPVTEPAATALDGKVNPDAPLSPPKDLVQNEYRGFLAGDLFHHTVKDRPGHNNPPADSARETEAGEAKALKISEFPTKAPAVGGTGK